jgi:23S rRNA pseudouridine2604 synthase
LKEGVELLFPTARLFILTFALQIHLIAILERLQCRFPFPHIPGMPTPVRLAKRLAEILPCSRREAELYIAGGWVMVDGLVVEEPQFMVSGEKIELHSEASLTPLEPATIMLDQPADTGINPSAALQLIRAETRAADDPSGIHMLKQHFLRLTPHIPLERNASGMAIYTQDWRAARKLSDDAATLEQEYIVEVAGELPPEGLKLLNHGLTYNGRALPPIKVSWQNETRLRFALKGAQPGQIAHMCQSVGLQVLAMKRIRIGRVAMGKLPPGHWRYLMPQERF